MVASSVVSTILILNYHHRSADTHEMSEWVSKVTFFFFSEFSWNRTNRSMFWCIASTVLGAVSVFILAAMYTENESTTWSWLYGIRLSADSMLK